MYAGKYGALGGVVVKALRYYSEGPGIDPRSLGIFSGALGSSIRHGVDSASKNKYHNIPGGKDGRCRVSRNSGALTYQKPQRPLGL